jgi:arabinose-5-phosphate isomerase
MTSSLARAARDLETTADEVMLTSARRALASQVEALARVASRLETDFCRAVRLILACRGRVVVCGVGKSGLIGRKLAASFSCTGTPSHFLHAAEASHGDLGMVTGADLIVIISTTGNTPELVRLLPHFQELGTPIIALVGDAHSAVARAADAVIDISARADAKAPDASSTTSLAALAIGDAMASVAMKERGLEANHLDRYRPRSVVAAAGRRSVRDVMKSRSLPVVTPSTCIGEALLTMSTGRSGLVVIVNPAGSPLAFVTETEIRRGLETTPDLLGLPVSELADAPVPTVSQELPVRVARERMHRLGIQAMIAVDAANRVVGVVHMLDD